MPEQTGDVTLILGRGLTCYEKFFGKNRQRCWAHIIREADAQSEKTDSPEVRAAGQRLKWQMHCAKGLGPPEEAARQYDSRVAETREIAATYKKGTTSGPIYTGKQILPRFLGGLNRT